MSKSAIIYARFSPRPNVEKRKNAKKVERKELSNIKQEERCRAYCKLYDYEVIKPYKDVALSGKDMERPGLQAALSHVCRIKGVLVVYSIDRFARSVIDGAKATQKLCKAGAEFVSITEHVDTTSPAGRCFFNILLAFSQMERERISERTKAAMLKYQSEGRIMSKRLPYGHQVDPDNPKRMVPEPYEQKTVRLMVGLKAQGWSFRRIAQYLVDTAHPPRTGRKWHHSTLKAILQRESQ